jgi:peroxiredoxin
VNILVRVYLCVYECICTFSILTFSHPRTHTHMHYHYQAHLLSLVHENALERYDAKVSGYKSFKSNQKDQTENVFVKLEMLVGERRELELFALDMTNACHTQKAEYERQFSARRAHVMGFVARVNKLRTELADSHKELLRRTGKIYGFTEDDQRRAILKRLHKHLEEERQEHVTVFKEAKAFREHLEVFVTHNANNSMLSERALAKQQKAREKKKLEIEEQLRRADEEGAHAGEEPMDELVSLLMSRQSSLLLEL